MVAGSFQKEQKRKDVSVANSGTDFCDLMVILRIIVVIIPTSKVLIGRIFWIF